jgi:hypothetical protein
LGINKSTLIIIVIITVSTIASSRILNLKAQANQMLQRQTKELVGAKTLKILFGSICSRNGKKT